VISPRSFGSQNAQLEYGVRPPPYAYAYGQLAVAAAS
jgi:hypothetical protein